MNSAAVALLICLLALYAQGQPVGGSNKCKCLNGFMSVNHKAQIQGTPVIHWPSSFCQHAEIIVMTRDNKQKCLNPKSGLGKLILLKARNGKNRATTTAGSTGPQSTTRL